MLDTRAILTALDGVSKIRDQVMGRSFESDTAPVSTVFTPISHS